jgi:glycosyltransferase involved in cell wall biosynthesis
MKLSIVIPVYNEVRTIREIIRSVVAVPLSLDKEVVVVDDGSTDGTREALRLLQADYPGWPFVFHGANRGKGAALRSGFRAATGDIVLVQSTNLEYDPGDYPALLAPILDRHADVVFGSRFLGGGPHRVACFWHYAGNKLLTTLSNMMTNLTLTDVEAGYKVFRKQVLDAIDLREERLGFDPEIAAKVARGRWKIYEVPVRYYGRDYAEGQKITWRDGVRALWCILKYRFV